MPRVVASGVWTAENTFTMITRSYETPFVHTISFRFTDDQLAIDMSVNVSFGPKEMSLTARSA